MSEDHPERTPKAWAAECLTLLQQMNSDYRRNRDVSGRCIEFVRPDPTGLLVSQNFIRIRRVYYLCYALCFSTLRTGWLYHPLFAGSRFDHNGTIWQQFERDFGVRRGDAGFPVGLWSFGEWRSNSMALLARGFALNDEHLFPVYRRILAAGKGRLIALFDAAHRLIPLLDPQLPILEQAARLGVDPGAVESFPLRGAKLDAFTIARGGPCYVGGGPSSNTVDLDTIPPDVIALHFADTFRLNSSRLAEILAIAEAL